MAISYDPLKQTMEIKSISWYTLAQEGIDNRTIHRLRHNENITTKTLEKLCNIIKCTPNDIVTFTDDI